MKTTETIGSRLRALRVLHQKSQDEMARLLGVDRSTYVKYENNKNKPSRNVSELARIFNVSTDYILTGEQQTHGQPGSAAKASTKNLLDIILAGGSDSLREKIAKLQFTKNGEIIDADAIYKLTDAQKLALCQFLEMALEAAERSGKT